MKAAFLGGDYLVQFYPWSKIYSEAIKNFTFPFWTRYIGSGFPLMAEGQIGGFYPLNIIMFFFLPFNIAYNYSVVLHFILAGIFTYIYTRKLGADSWGGSLSALLFCFGSSFAGCFYNIVTLKTLAWFPVVLFLFEKYFENKRFRYILTAGCILGIQLLAGFTQMAAYSALFYFLYFCSGLNARKEFKLDDLFKIIISFFVALIIFFPQLILNLPLVGLCGRANASLGFALWGSFSPLNLLSLYFPCIMSQGMQFYIGVFSLFFLSLSILNLKVQKNLRPLFLIVILAVFLALGTYNPLYVLFLKLTKLYLFRNPSKFIFFAVFASAVLSGCGFSAFFEPKRDKNRKRALRVFISLTSAVLIIFSLMRIILYSFKSKIVAFGQWYAAKYIFGQAYHRYSLATYLEKVNNLYTQIINNTSISNIFVAASLIICLLSLLIAFILLRKEKIHLIYKNIFLSLISIDIFVFSFYGIGFRGNIKPFSYIVSSHKKILKILKSDRELFRILPFSITRSNIPFWAKPNANILVGIDSVALYTPLAQQSYKDAFSSLEVVDDSLGLLSPNTKVLEEKQSLLKLLNIKYVISARDISFSFLEKLIEEDGVSLYRFKDYLPRVFFTENITGEIKADRTQAFKIKDYKEGFMKLEITVQKKGFIIFCENYYPGWQVYVDDKTQRVIKVKDLIQGVAVEKGRHTIIFEYKAF
jgi:hypothetical protein